MRISAAMNESLRLLNRAASRSAAFEAATSRTPASVSIRNAPMLALRSLITRTRTSSFRR